MPSFKPLAYLLGAASLALAEPATTRLATGDITRSIQLLGEVKPLQQVTLNAKVSGYVKALRVDLGDHVEAGAILAELEVPELAADEARTRAELTLAELEHKRLQEASRTAPDLVVRQSVDAAEAKLAVARAQHQRNATLLSFAVVRAPFAGVISRRYVDIGAFVPAGGSPAPLFTLTDAAVVRIQVAVPETEAALVALGQPLVVTTEATGGKSFVTKVTRIAGTLDHPSQTMLAEADVPNAGGELKPGMFASVKLGLETHKQTLLLPLAAVIMEKAVATAYVNEGGIARRRVLKSGFNDGINLEVLGGLKPDDVVLLPAGKTLADGQLLK